MLEEATAQPPAADASDPHASDPGKPSQRDLQGELLAALKVAVETIRIWHGFGHATDEAEVWALYQQSPEMRAITAAIAKAEGR